ncbi:uncharacterized protein LOC103066203 isoform X7 [Python bivittatus]|uniref:Uncharacterized protein LOC103066203 isoform X7 n=1 Tax=Python bivittatus TaxID=176946 RepID=A0A9F5IQX9_PYTBI|nr:uncharacterized protein LOC103066203 isoform X7 [Python bivittatus]
MSGAPARCRVFVWLRRGCGALAHLAALGMTVFLLLLSRPGTSLFSWHPVFMSIALCYGMDMPEGIKGVAVQQVRTHNHLTQVLFPCESWKWGNTISETLTTSGHCDMTSTLGTRCIDFW